MSCNNQTQVYWNGTSFFSATAFFSDSALTTPSPDGWYAFGGMIRQISNGVLLSAVPCDSCVIPCGDPFIFGGGGTGKYTIDFSMGTVSGAAAITFNTGSSVTGFFPVPDQCTWTYNNVSASEYSSLLGGYMKGLIGVADGDVWKFPKSCLHGQSSQFLTADLGTNGVQSQGDDLPYNISTGTFPSSGPTVDLGSQVAPIGFTGLTNNTGPYQSTLLSWNCSAQTSNNCSSGTPLGVPSSPYNNNLPLAPNLRAFSTGGTTQWNSLGMETRGSVMVVPSPPNVGSNILSLTITGPCYSTWWGIDVPCPEPLTALPASTIFGDLEFDQSPAGQASKTPLADVCAYPLDRFIYHVPVDAWGNTNPNSKYYIPGDNFPNSPKFDPITGLPLGQPNGVLGLGDWVFEDENGVTPLPVGVYKTQFDALDGLGLRSWAVQVGPREYKDVASVNVGGQLNALPPEDYVGQVWGPDWAGAGITFNDVQETGARVDGIVRSITPCDPIDSFDCDPTTGLCSDPGTGLGQYLTLADCNNNCNPPASWDCVGGACVDPGTGLGQYSTLSACNAVCNPIASCSGSFATPQLPVGQYNIDMDAGATTGAIIVRFEPYQVPDRCTWTYDGVSASEYSSATDGYLQGIIGCVDGGGPQGCGQNGGQQITNGTGSNGVTFAGTVSNWNPTTNAFVSTGNSVNMGPYTNQASGGTTLTPGLVGPGFSMMVIPKPNATPSLVQFQMDGPCGSTIFNFEANCPVDLSIKNRGDLGGICQAYTTDFYTASPHTTDGLSPANLQVHDWVFEDINGVTPLPAGDYPARFPGGPHKIMTVSTDGVITALVGC